LPIALFILFLWTQKNPEQNEPGIDFDWNQNKRKKLPSSNKFPPPRPHAQALADAIHAAELQTELALQSTKKNITKQEPGHQMMKDGEDFGQHAFSTGSVTALHVAAAQHNLQAVREAVQSNPDAVHSRDDNAWTPLHESARAGGDIDVIETLLNSGSDLGARTISGSTALWIARQYNNAKIVTFLESIGALEIPDDEL